MEWCGARNGRSTSSPRSRSSPATLWTVVASSASSRAERGEQAGQPARQHGLAAARRAEEEQVVVAGGGDLEGALGRLPARPRPGGRARHRGVRAAAPRPGERPGRPRPSRPGHQLAEVADRVDLKPLHRRGLEGVSRRRHEAPRTVAQRGHGHGEHPAHRAAPRRRGRAPRQRWSPSSGRGGTSPQAASSATAMGRSNPVPSLRRSAGARLTVMRLRGKLEARGFAPPPPTRTSASCTAPPASPVSWMRGKPVAASTSTSTGTAATPSRAEERTRTNIGRGDEQGSCRGRVGFADGMEDGSAAAGRTGAAPARTTSSS